MSSAKQALGRGRRSSMIVSLVAALLAVAALPLGLAAYQIHLARESLVDQAQRTHLIAARATADRVQAALSEWTATAASAAQNPQLYTEPASAEAAEVLAGLLVGQSKLQVAALFYRQDGRDSLVQMARQPGAAVVESAWLAALPESGLLQRSAEGLHWGVSIATPRPGLRLALRVDAGALENALLPRELGPSARLLLLQGDALHPAFASDAVLPEPLRAALAQPQLDALAARADAADGVEVSAFARVLGTDWSVASLQPAAEAEAAAARMRQGALAAVLAVLLLIGGLSLFAWRRVVRPVRALLAWQSQSLSGEEDGGSDLARLRDAFAQIQRNQRNRAAFGEVFVGRYRLLSTLGQGAMGSVFLAWDPGLKRHVAIKTIHLDELDTRSPGRLMQLLEGEAVKVAKLKHPNVVAVHDLVAAGEFAFVVMEYVEGGNLRQLIDHHGELDFGEVVLVARSLLGALSAAHRSGLLHLDIKPSNLLVSPEGEVKLGDFGVAAWRSEIPHLAAAEGAAGTPGFIAPEYLAGSAPTVRSDLFSVGVVLMECLTGIRERMPGARPLDLGRIAQRRKGPPAGARAEHVALWVAVQSLASTEPAQRPESAAAALELFARFDAGDAQARLAARAIEISGKRPTAPSDAPTRLSPQMRAQPGVPSASAEGAAVVASDSVDPNASNEDATRRQPWAEETRKQTWAEPTQPQPWAVDAEPATDDSAPDAPDSAEPQLVRSVSERTRTTTRRQSRSGRTSLDDTTRPLEPREP